MANEVLNKTAQHLARHHRHCKVISLNWGPWEGGMVTTSLKKEFTKRGIALIELDTGARCLVQEMLSAHPGPVEVVIGGLIPPASPPTPEAPEEPSRTPRTPQLPNKKNGGNDPSAKTTSMTRSAALHDCPVLASHTIAGEPVLPLALMMEWFAHAATHANPGLVFTGLDDVRVLKGIKPGRQEMPIDIRTGRCIPTLGKFVVAGDLLSSNRATPRTMHASAKIMLENHLPSPPVLDQFRQTALPQSTLSMNQVYDDILFHGEDLQGIRSITGCSPMGIEVVAKQAPAPSAWITAPHRKKWLLDPLIMDCAFQAAIIWCHENLGMRCLPTYIANLRIYKGFADHEGDVTILFTVNEQTSHTIKGYFTFIDQQGKVIAGITGFEAVMDPSLAERFSHKKKHLPTGSSNQEQAPRKRGPASAAVAAVATGTGTGSLKSGPSRTDVSPSALFSRDKILAFAVGAPSRAFGNRYQKFDKDREIARLPGPPYFFMDRVIKTDHQPWQMAPGGWIEAQFDLPEGGWYFKAAKSDTLPFSILLEIALQPCGWLAAYAGSALHSEERLYFRNLGGEARLISPVHRSMGTLTMRSRLTAVSKAGGLIIQDFDMEVLNNDTLLYQGHTNFGFFTRASLSNQSGIKNTPFNLELTQEQKNATSLIRFKDTAPITPEDAQDDRPDELPAKALRMIDAIDVFLPVKGKYQKGYLRAEKKVDPEEWFFKAHFYQDPVCPGSLGVESFLQVMQYFAMKTWKIDPEKFQVSMAPHAHKWIYRGQIVPTARQVQLQVHIKAADRKQMIVTADGILLVDGLCIYQMEDFSICLIPR